MTHVYVKNSSKDYRIFTSKVRLVKIIDVSHMTSPNFAFKSNRSIRSNQQSNSSCSTSRSGRSFCIDLIDNTSNKINRIKTDINGCLTLMLK